MEMLHRLFMLGLTTSPAFTALAPAPVQRFTDCKSGREVVLVGCMHCNPVSVQLVEDVIRSHGEAEALGAVVLETCSQRWESSPRSWAFNDEMQVAAELAEEYACGLALADQPIDVTSARLAQLTKLTAVQLATGRWRRVWEDIVAGWAALQPELESGVGPMAFVEPGLLAGAPVAVLRYLAASPSLAAVLIAVAAVLSAAVGASEPLSGAPTVSELTPSVALALLESVLLLRVSLVGLVEERNFVLARHIRACSMQVMTPPRAVRQRGRGKDGRTVVAVMGLAHLNGVRRILTTSRTM